MIGRLAERYLRWRGHVVLPRPFTGIVFGHCEAMKIGGDNTRDYWHVTSPKGGRIYAINNSIVISDPLTPSTKKR